ncbi:MAG: acetyltransferase [Cyclobacteriaceae bacterium]
MPELLWLIGGGGHARSVIDVLEMQGHYRIAGIADRAEKIGEKVLGYLIAASDQELAALVSQDHAFLITVGQLESPKVRVRLYEALRVAGGQFATIVSPLARLSPHARIGEGTVVLHHALVNAGASVGSNAIINTQAIVEHDTHIGDHCHIATGAIVNGGVQLGDRTFIGSHATVKQGVKITDDVVVGAHSYVQQDITEAGVYVGVPAKRIR